MEYHYTHKNNVSESELTITDKEAHHLKNVLRKKVGDELFVTDGERNLYKVMIEEIVKEKIHCKINEKMHNVNESQKNVHLYLALLKNPSRFEFAIEKCVEVGVNEITPIITEHTINKKIDKNQRWQMIALSAMKQSQRCYLPKINHPISFNEAVQNCKTSLCLLADEREAPPFLPLYEVIDKGEEKPITQNKTNNISLFIGPEGGFSNEEVEYAKENHFKIVSLGTRKFRSETAAIVGLSNLLRI